MSTSKIDDSAHAVGHQQVTGGHELQGRHALADGDELCWLECVVAGHGHIQIAEPLHITGDRQGNGCASAQDDRRGRSDCDGIEGAIGIAGQNPRIDIGGWGRGDIGQDDG